MGNESKKAFSSVKAKKSRRISQLLKLFTNPPKITIHEKHTPYSQKVLLVCRIMKNHTYNFHEFVDDMHSCSTYRMDTINLEDSRTLPPGFNGDEYDAIVLHNTITSSPISSLDYFDKFCKFKLRDYKGLKIVMYQDENYRPDTRADFAKRNNFDIIYTVSRGKLTDLMYPPSEMGGIKVISANTGYVNEALRTLPYPFKENREIDVGYRGAKNYIQLGRHLYEKAVIGEKFLKNAEGYNLVTDISSEPEKRMHTGEWRNFLATCKGTLSIESGTDIVDFDGSINDAYAEYIKNNPNASDEEILTLLDQFVTDTPYKCISPRHLEAAATHTVQIMYEGEFQGIFLPYRHYLPLKSDWSNFSEIMELFLNPKERKRITECAYEEIVLNPEYSMETFMRGFDAQLHEYFGNTPA